MARQLRAHIRPNHDVARSWLTSPIRAAFPARATHPVIPSPTRSCEFRRFIWKAFRRQNFHKSVVGLINTAEPLEARIRRIASDQNQLQRLLRI